MYSVFRSIVVRERSSEGFSLLEAIVVIALMAAILLVSVPSLVRMLNSYRTTTAAAQLALDVRFTRNACVKNKFPYRIAFFDNSHSTKPNTYEVLFDADRNGAFENSTQHKLDQTILIDASATNIDELEFNNRGFASDTAVAPITSPFRVVLKNKSYPEMAFQISISNVGGVESLKLGNW